MTEVQTEALRGDTSKKTPPDKSEAPEGGDDQGKSKPDKDSDGEEKDDEYVDVCGYIGGGVETISGFQQQNFQDHLSGIPVNADNAQTENLHKIKETTERSQKTTALTQ